MSLFKRINSFYKSAWLSLIKNAREIQNSSEFLLKKSEDFDFKNEQAFELFDRFIENYKEFLELTNFDIASIAEKDFRECTELASNMEKRYKRLLDLTYFSLSEDEGYEEEFSSDEFYKYINDVMDDIKNKIKDTSDMEISDAMAENIAAEFNANPISNMSQYFNEGMTITGPVIQKQLAAVRRFFANLKFNYESAMSVKATKKRYYEKLKADRPEEFKKYTKTIIENKNERYAKRTKLLNDIDSTNDPVEKAKLRKELAKFENNLLNKVNRQKKDDEGKIVESNISPEEAEAYAREQINKSKNYSNETKRIIKERIQSGSLQGLLDKLAIDLAESKKNAKSRATTRISKDKRVVELKLSLNKIGEELKTSNTPELQSQEKQLKELNVTTITELMNLSPEIIECISDIQTINEYRKRIMQSLKAGWIDINAGENEKQFCKILLEDGLVLVGSFSQKYKAVAKTISLINQEIEKIL